MLTAKKITKQDLPLLRDCAQRLVQTRGKGIVRESIRGISVKGNTTYGVYMDGIIVGWKIVDKDGRVISDMGITTLEDGGMPVFADEARPSADQLAALGFAEGFDRPIEDDEIGGIVGYDTPNVAGAKADPFSKMRAASAEAFDHDMIEPSVIAGAKRRKEELAKRAEEEAERQARLDEIKQRAEDAGGWMDDDAAAEANIASVAPLLLANAERNASARERYGVRGRKAEILNQDPFRSDDDAIADDAAGISWSGVDGGAQEDPFADFDAIDGLDLTPSEGSSSAKPKSKPKTVKRASKKHGGAGRQGGDAAHADALMFGRIDCMPEGGTSATSQASGKSGTKEDKPKIRPAKAILGIVLCVATLIGVVAAIWQGLGEISGDAGSGSGSAQQAGMGSGFQLDWDNYPKAGAGELVHVRVMSGMAPQDICEALAEAGLVDIAREFLGEVESQGAAGSLATGEYVIPVGESASSVVSRMASGKRVPDGVMGVNYGDALSTIASAIDKAGLPYNGGDFLNSASDVTKWRGSYSMLAEVPEGLPTIEGYIASDEYDLSHTATADEAVALMMEPMQEMFEGSGMSSAGFHAMLTKASLIEKEALFDEDRPLISSVIDNRLEAGAKLQIDAAVKYANGYDEARVYDSHLEMDSPYNTYMYPGLPIGPICSGIAQVDIDAAMAPAQTDYFYYVLEDTAGHHRFCVTPEEFEMAKQEYLELFGYDG